MFRSFLPGRVNLVRLLQHQHDLGNSNNNLLQFHSDIGQRSSNFSAHLNADSNDHSSTSTTFYNTSQHQSNRFLFVALLKHQIKHHQTEVIYPQPTSAYIQEVMTISDLNNSTSSEATVKISSNPNVALKPRKNNSTIEKSELLSRDNKNGSEMYITENSHKNEWKANEEEERKGSKQSSEDSSAYNEFQKLNVKLIELGAALAVGIEVQNRISEWMPPVESSFNHNRKYGTLRSLGDLCHGHTHNYTSFGLPIPTEHPHERYEDASFTGKCSNTSEESVPMTIAPYCSYCSYCNIFYGKLLFTYVFKSLPDRILPNFSYVGPRLNVFDQKFEKLTLPCSENDENKVGAASEKLNSVTKSRKKSLFFTDEQYAKIQMKIENGGIQKPSQISKAISHVSQNKKDVQCQVTSNDELDIGAFFSKAVSEYADRLNNIVAMDLMQSHRPDEAMKCWINSEASAKAFFNMGVAFESGRYALRAQPDLNRAHDCYAIAASMGHREATFNLALFYLYGKGKIQVDLDFGMLLLEAAARKGLLTAQAYVAELQRRQMVQEVRSKLQRKIPDVQNVPMNRAKMYNRSTASTIGIRPRKTVITKESITIGGTLKRVNSAPNLIGMVADSKIVRRK